MTRLSDNAARVADMMECPTEGTVAAVLHAFLMGSKEERHEVVELIVAALQANPKRGAV